MCNFAFMEDEFQHIIFFAFLVGEIQQTGSFYGPEIILEQICFFLQQRKSSVVYLDSAQSCQ